MLVLDKGPYACGETPLSCNEGKIIWWVDASTHELFRYSAESGQTDKFKPEVAVTAIREGSEDSFTLLTKWGLYTWTPWPEDGIGRILEGHDYLDPSGTLRFNDGIPLTGGGFAAGAFDESDLFNGQGSFHLIQPDGIHRVLDKVLHVPNGVALSKDGSTLYLSEMYQYRILAYRMDWDNGSVVEKTTFINLPEKEGKPDGLLVDSADNIWIAHWRGWQLSRYDREGRRNLTVKTPFASPTCPCFKDERESSLIVTTATLELNHQELKKSQLPGAVYEVYL